MQILMPVLRQIPDKKSKNPGQVCPSVVDNQLASPGSAQKISKHQRSIYMRKTLLKMDDDGSHSGGHKALSTPSEDNWSRWKFKMLLVLGGIVAAGILFPMLPDPESQSDSAAIHDNSEARAESSVDSAAANNRIPGSSPELEKVRERYQSALAKYESELSRIQNDEVAFQQKLNALRLSVQEQADKLSGIRTQYESNLAELKTLLTEASPEQVKSMPLFRQTQELKEAFTRKQDEYKSARESLSATESEFIGLEESKSYLEVLRQELTSTKQAYDTLMQSLTVGDSD